MKKIIFATIASIMIMLIFVFVLQPRGLQSKLVSPGLGQVFGQKVTPKPTPTPSPTPKTFQFNSSTDLKKELESVNPQVLDSDFEGL